MPKLKGLLLTEGMHGMISQVEGLAKALDIEFTHQKVELNNFWKLIPPKFTPISNLVFQNFDTPDFDIIISCGRKSVIPSIYLKKKFKNKIMNIHIQDPKVSLDNFDFIVAPEHDGLKGKNVLITGASSGIGRACAVLASTYGANVVLVGRNTNRLKQTQSKLLKGKHLCFNQDITENEKIEKIVGQTVEKIGKISGFVHSAGMEMTVPLQSMKPDYYYNLFAINAVSGFELVRIISKNKYLEETFRPIASSVAKIAGRI